MIIDRVVLHGLPGDPAGQMRMHPVRVYEGDPATTIEYRMHRLDGGFVFSDNLILFLTHTDDSGIPHYKYRGPQSKDAP